MQCCDAVRHRRVECVQKGTAHFLEIGQEESWYTDMQFCQLIAMPSLVTTTFRDLSFSRKYSYSRIESSASSNNIASLTAAASTSHLYMRMTRVQLYLMRTLLIPIPCSDWGRTDTLNFDLDYLTTSIVPK